MYVELGKQMKLRIQLKLHTQLPQPIYTPIHTYYHTQDHYDSVTESSKYLHSDPQMKHYHLTILTLLKCIPLREEEKQHYNPTILKCGNTITCNDDENVSRVQHTCAHSTQVLLSFPKKPEAKLI